MALFLKVGIEVLLLVVLIFLSNAFWPLLRLPSMFKAMFGNREVADAAVDRNRNKVFHKSKVIEMEQLEPMLQNATNSMGLMILLGSYFEATVKTWRRVKNFHLFVLVVLIAGSWMISPYVMLLNLIVFLAYGKFITASPDAIAEMLGSFQLMAAIIEEWYDRFPSECEKFCTMDSMQHSTVFSAVSEFGTIPYSDWK
jgi:ABC-type multidrug transport system fused ATPase/permease subunit